eukprot:1153840-Pelagomonas_calceolata.AAC.2
MANQTKQYYGGKPTLSATLCFDPTWVHYSYCCRCKVEEAKKEAEARVKPAASSLLAAAEAVGSLRAQSSYNWVNLTELFGVLDSSKRKSDRLSL